MSYETFIGNFSIGNFSEEHRKIRDILFRLKDLFRSEEERAEAVDLVRSMLPHVSDCEGVSVYFLMRHPELQERLRADPWRTCQREPHVSRGRPANAVARTQMF